MPKIKFNKNILIADIELQLMLAKAKCRKLDDDALKAFKRFEKSETIWNDKEVALDNAKKWVRSLTSKLSAAKRKYKQ